MSFSAFPSIDVVRQQVSAQLDPERRSALGQFMTPSRIAEFMASLFRRWPSHCRLLDPGAGIGSLTEAFVGQHAEKAPRKGCLDVEAYEIDPLLLGHLQARLQRLESTGHPTNREVRATGAGRDFIVEGSFALSFADRRFTHAILNPPYKKIGATSQYRKLLRQAGIETVNLYTAFLGLAVALVENGGEIVAIVPRSFCNGAYFRPFREWLLERVAIRHIHVFESRHRAFADDDVLQENIIVYFQRGAPQSDVVVSNCHDPGFSDYVERRVPFEEIVHSTDPQRFIHIPTVTPNGSNGLFAHSLAELGLGVSTGPVVDFRLKNCWLAEPAPGAVPLLYAHHFGGETFQWPRSHKKPNALKLNPESRKWLMPRGWYVLTKRFSAKEERRRIVAYALDPSALPHELYGFENHLNVIHQGKAGLEPYLARGLALFLNTTLVDEHFRTFSGHTQVNATDLRAMRFPSRATLTRFGKWAERRTSLTQEAIDKFVARHHGR